jgi:hypothetical protein
MSTALVVMLAMISSVMVAIIDTAMLAMIAAVIFSSSFVCHRFLLPVNL